MCLPSSLLRFSVVDPGGGNETSNWKSSPIAERVAMDQFEAMGTADFDVGQGVPMAPCCWVKGGGARQMLKSVLWLRRENLNCRHIYTVPRNVSWMFASLMKTVIRSAGRL